MPFYRTKFYSHTIFKKMSCLLLWFGQTLLVFILLRMAMRMYLGHKTERRKIDLAVVTWLVRLVRPDIVRVDESGEGEDKSKRKE